MMKALNAMQNARESDDSLAYAEADTEFHDAIFEHCGNPLFVEAFDIVTGRMAALRTHLSDALGLHRQKTFEEHQQMVEAVRSKDVDRLRGLLPSHIEAVETNYAAALQMLSQP